MRLKFLFPFFFFFRKQRFFDGSGTTIISTVEYYTRILRSYNNIYQRILDLLFPRAGEKKWALKRS